MPLIDLTQTIYHQMPVFPGEESPAIVEDMAPKDAEYVTFRLTSNMHSGTHMDAPLHAKSGNITIDSYPPGFFMGKAKVLDVRGKKVVEMQAEWVQDFLEYEIILFCTNHDINWQDPGYYIDYPIISDEVAVALKESGVRIVGVDTPSPDKYPFNFHRIFLNGNCFLVENLTNLDQLLGIEEIEFIAFPLKIKAEASLIRAVVKY